MYVRMYAGPVTESRLGGGCENFRTVHTDHGAHPDCCTMGTGILPGFKPPERSVDHCLLAPRLRMGEAILFPLWARQDISCSGLYLDFTLSTPETSVKN